MDHYCLYLALHDFRIRFRSFISRAYFPSSLSLQLSTIFLSACSSCLLRSADCCDLLVPCACASLFQHYALAVVGPALWNDILMSLQSLILHLTPYHRTPFDALRPFFS